MPRAVLKNGVICPLEPLPSEWEDGRELRVELAVNAGEISTRPLAQIAPAMLRSQKAFWRDLPELLKLKSNDRQWAAYFGDERIAFGRTDVEVYQKCFGRGLQRGEFYVGRIKEHETVPWGTLGGDWSLYECTDGEDKDTPPGAV